MHVKHDTLSTRLITPFAAAGGENCRILVCTDYRFLDIGDIMNLFLKRLATINGFYVFGYRWNRRRELALLDHDKDLMNFINKVTLTLNKYPHVRSRTSIFISRQFEICLPKREYLTSVGSESVVEDLLMVGSNL